MPSADVTIERRAVKNARLRVRDTGAVELVVPERFTAAQVDGLLSQKASWIADKRRYFANRAHANDRLAPNEVRLFGATFLFIHSPHLKNRTELDHGGRQIRTGVDLTDADTRRRWC